ncbi:MAG: hypothetical protein JWO25_2646 [Alphaproteobacteria bacterium]|nr:hypothetical protein [Alphaproteobacteria bacterium]
MRILDVDAVPPGEAHRHSDHLVPGEAVGALFVSPTGTVMFTDRRILIVVREHLLDERAETSSYPYREIRRFSIQEGSETRANIRIWLGEDEHPLHLRANPGTELGVLQRLLAERLA